MSSAPPYPDPPTTAARWRLPEPMRRPYTGTAPALPARGRARSPREETMPTPTDDALAWLAAQRGAMEDLLRALVEASSFTRDPSGVAAVVSGLEDALARLGVAPGPLAVDRIGGGARFGPHLALEGRVAGPPVFLVGHADTVFPADTFAGFRREGDRALGPGVFDMKGGLAVMVFGLAAAARAGLLVVTRRKGVASLRAEARGVAAHAGNEPERGRSAIWALARLVERAQALSDPARGVSVNVGTFHGGTSKNTVPELAECDSDLRYTTAEDGRALEAALEGAARDAALPGTSIVLSRGAARLPLERTERSAALAAEYGACQRASGLGAGEAPLAGGGSDACTTAEVEMPSIDGLGPRGAGYHTRDEEVDLTSLVPKAQALFRFLAARAR